MLFTIKSNHSVTEIGDFIGVHCKSFVVPRISHVCIFSFLGVLTINCEDGSSGMLMYASVFKLIKCNLLLDAILNVCLVVFFVFSFVLFYGYCFSEHLHHVSYFRLTPWLSKIKKYTTPVDI